MEIIKMFQTSFWTCSFQVVQESEIIWIGKWLPLILCSHSLIKPSLTNRNSSSTIVRPDWFNIPCTHCLQCQPFKTNLELAGIELILMITSQVIRAPHGARAYPYLLSKYFLCVCPSVRPSVRPCVRPSIRASVRPPTDKRRVCILCAKQHFFVIF